VAESDEVRMAAITVLPYTRPSSIYLNKLAIRTWWEPSHQVRAYITSILRTLADPEVARLSKIYNDVFEPAKEALRMAKPTDTGIQNSHEIIISQFLDTLQAGVNMKMQYVISEESQWPRNVYMKTSIRSKSHIVNALEAGVHMEGAPFLINKLYEIYSTFLPEAEQERMNKNKADMKTIINIESRRMRRPEAHITIKSMGFQRIFSIDSRMVEELIEKVAIGSIDALRTHKRHSYDFLKIADLNGHNAIIPTESGLPVYMSHQTPLVVSGKANTEIVLQNLKNIKAGITIKPVINYKQIVEAGIYCPFTKRFLGTGVDSAIHFALPLATEVAFKDGQFSINIKTPEDQESQKEKPVVEIRVKPYTSNYDITSSSLVPLSKSVDSKVIRSNRPLKVKDVNIGEALGLALNLKVETEQPFIDVAEIIHQLSLHKPLTLLTLPFPLHTVRDHSIKVMYNPQTSITKEASFSILSGRALRQSSSDIPLITTYSDEKMNQTIVDVCKQQIIDWKTQQDESIKKELEEHLERCILIKPRAECETEMELRHQEEADEREVKCIIEENSKLEMAKCVEERGIQSRPSSEIHSYCTKKIVLYKQKHSAINDIKKWTNIGLSEIQGSSRAITVHMQANLHGPNHAVVKGVAAFGMVGKDNENTMVKVLAGVKTHNIREPYIFGITGIRNSKMPTNIWDKEAMLTEDLTSTIRIQAVGGTRFVKLFDFELDIITERSEEMKAHAKNSESWKLCEVDSSKELRLSSQCRKARILASSLDVIKMELSLPKALTTNPHIVTLTNALKAYYLPYLTFQDSRYNRQDRNNDYFQILAKVAPDSNSLTFSVAAEAKSTVFNNLRLAPFMKYFLPICSKNSFPLRLVDMITDGQRPASCSVEGNKVSTFDKLIYDYPINDCEHVMFGDCTDSPNVMVLVRKTSTQHIIRVAIDGEIYKLTINKGSRGSRTNPGQVEINGQVKQPSPKKEGEAITFQDTWNQISLYDDGVYEIFSFKYGLTVRADGNSAEVKSWSHKLRNLACGLCGDLNDEKTGDVLSSQQCVMSSPKLAAYSYMVTNNPCYSSIPAQDKAAYQEETKQCIKKTTVPPNVYNIFIQRQLDTKTNQVLMKHLVLERGQNICISVKQVEVCPMTSSPAEVVPTEISFFCVSKDQDGSTLKAIALSGERINQADRFPIAFTSTVHTPNRC